MQGLILGLARTKAQTLAPALSLGLFAALAVFLRVYDLHAFAWIPDHYDRLTDARLLLSGHLPESKVYPPGAALVFALAMIFAPDSLTTIAAVILLSSLLSLALGYVLIVRYTADKWAALLFVALGSISPIFVKSSRDGVVDVIVTALILLAVILLPAIRHRSALMFVGYGCLLALLINIRPSNGAIVLPLGLYWLALDETGLSPRRIWRSVFGIKLSVCAVTVFVLHGLSLYTGQWSGGGYSGLITLSPAILFTNLAGYCLDTFHSFYGAPLLLPLAILGAVQLWQINRPLFWPVVSLIVLWPVIYSPFFFVSPRYMLPALLFVLVLACIGASSIFRQAKAGVSAFRFARTSSVIGLGTIGLLFFVSTVGLLAKSPYLSSVSDEGLSAEVSPVLSSLGPDPLLVSAVTRGLHDQPVPLQFLDLIDLSIDARDRSQARAKMLDEIGLSLSHGRSAYYLYSHLESKAEHFGGIWDDYESYFTAVRQTYTVREIWRTKALRNGRLPWILYEVTQKDTLPGEDPRGKIASSEHNLIYPNQE